MMDIANDLEKDFANQAFQQLETAKNEPYQGKNKQRLYRYNIFEDVTARRKEFIEKKLLKLLFSLGRELNHSIKESLECPVMIPNRHLKTNFVYDQHGVVYLKPKKSVRYKSMAKSSQAFMLHLIIKVIRLIKGDQFVSKRELYYSSLNYCQIRYARTNTQQTTSQTHQHVNQSQQPASQSQQSTRPQVKNSQSKLETMINDLCCLVGCSAVHLRILTEPKGIIYGHLKFKLRSGQIFDCQSKKEGMFLPTAQEPIIHVESDAKFILLIEKNCILQKILNLEESTNFVRDYKVILFTAKGYPDISSKAFLNYISSRLSIPILAMTDANPHGLEIVCSYKFGNRATAHEAPYVVLPHLKWLGLLPTDVKRLKIDDSKTNALTSDDIKKINSLLARPFFENNLGWIKQLHTMRELGRKADLESIDATGEYLVQTYLPNKLRYASWLS